MQMFNSNSVVDKIKLKRFLRYAYSILLFYVLSVSLVEFNILFVSLTLSYPPSSMIHFIFQIRLKWRQCQRQARTRLQQKPYRAPGSRLRAMRKTLLISTVSILSDLLLLPEPGQAVPHGGCCRLLRGPGHLPPGHGEGAPAGAGPAGDRRRQWTGLQDHPGHRG